MVHAAIFGVDDFNSISRLLDAIKRKPIIRCRVNLMKVLAQYCRQRLNIINFFLLYLSMSRFPAIKINIIPLMMMALLFIIGEPLISLTVIISVLVLLYVVIAFSIILLWVVNAISLLIVFKVVIVALLLKFFHVVIMWVLMLVSELAPVLSLDFKSAVVPSREVVWLVSADPTVIRASVFVVIAPLLIISKDVVGLLWMTSTMVFIIFSSIVLTIVIVVGLIHNAIFLWRLLHTQWHHLCLSSPHC